MKECIEVYKVYTNGEIVYEKVGEGNIEKIEYHSPQGEGDAHYCDIIYNTGITKRVFKPDTVTFAATVYI